MTFKIAGVEAVPSTQREQFYKVLLWGIAGCGKTTLAATMPGRKLLVNFDPGGDASVAGRDDVTVVDLSAAKPHVVELVKNADNPLGLKSGVDEFDSLVVDSLTNLQYTALMHGVSTSKGATIERPSLQGYGVRTALVTQAVKTILRFCTIHRKHVCFIAHEAQPTMNSDGVIMEVTMALGGQLNANTPVDFGEIWNVIDDGKKRMIAIRPYRQRKPCKTRMFVTDTNTTAFAWQYNKDKPTDMTHWYTQWKEGGYKKLALPK